MRAKSLSAFLTVALLLAIPAGGAHWVMGRFALHQAVNAYHYRLLDLLFPVLTEVANGWVPVCLSLLLLFKNWRSFLMMGLSTGLSAIVVQSLKRLVFVDFDRPSMYLERMRDLHLVVGVDLHHYNSFPSGHATAAFSMCLAMAVVAGKQGTAVLLAIGAALLAYTRVYLSQHFTEDIVAGALLGCSVGVGVYVLLYQTAWGKRNALDYSPFCS